MRLFKKGCRLALSLCSLLFSGCQDTSDQKLKVLLDWWPNPVHIPLYVGIDQGIWRDQGLELEVISTPEPPQALLFLLTGRADLVIYSAPNTLQALGRCPNLRLMGTLIDQPLRALMFLDDSSIREEHDLQDKILGGNPEGLLTAYVRSIMNSHGIQFREVRKLSWDAPTALLTGAVDVIAGVYRNIEPEQMLAAGIKTRYFPIEQFGVPHYDELVFLSTQQILEDHPHLQQRFQKGLKQTLDWCRDHPEESFSIYALSQTHKSERVLEWERIAWLKTVCMLAADQQADRARWSHLERWMAEHQLMKHKPDLGLFLGDEGGLAGSGPAGSRPLCDSL
jgi:NitT/TauT family transport system substrate-binding protein